MVQYFLLSLYPLYKTGECIRGWNKTNKDQFQKWLVFWFIYWLNSTIHTILQYLWIANYLWILQLYNCMAIALLLLCYTNSGIVNVRKFVILPLHREIRRFYPYLETHIKTSIISYGKDRFVRSMTK